MRYCIYLLFAIVLLTSCSNAPKVAQGDVPEALPLMVIDRPAFDRSFGMPCTDAKDCTLPLVCHRGLCDIPPSLLDRPSQDTPKLMLKSYLGEHKLNLEVVSTEYTRQYGMMKRRAFAQNWGMLFVFNNNKRRAFWMSHTYIPLDMVFIRKDGSTSNVHENAAPLDEGPRYISKDNVKYVLELPAGTIKKLGIDDKTMFDMAPFDSIDAE